MAPVLDMPRLHQPPLVLRAFVATDAPLVHEASADSFIPLVTTVPASADTDSVQAFIQRQHARSATGKGYSFAIADDASDQALGQIGLWPLDNGRANVGYWVVAAARRRGVASHALSMISAWGLELLGLARLELYVDPWNEGSWRAAERVGYQREGLLRSWEEVGSRRRDMYVYSLCSTQSQPPTVGGSF